MYKSLKVSKKEVEQIFHQMMGPEKVGKDFGKVFQLFATIIRDDSERVAATPNTITGLLGYYLDTQGVEYEKDGNDFHIWEETDSRMYEMQFRVDERNRQITLTYDLEEPIPEDRKMIVSELLTKINNMLYDQDVKLEIYNGQVRWKVSHTIKNDMTRDSMPGDVMRSSTVPAMIDAIIASSEMVYPALVAVFYNENADDAFEIMMDELHPLSWVFLHASRR